MAKINRYSVLIITFGLAISMVLSSCSESMESGSKNPITLKLVTYDSFPAKDTELNAALKRFEKQTGYKVKIINAGDAGAMVSKAVLTSGKPEGDVIWGVDNTMLSRAVNGNIFNPYEGKDYENISSEFTSLVKDKQVTPVDFGDVCINYDIAWFKNKELDPPRSLEDLVKPEYKGLLAVQDPASSSPGLAFLLATVDRFGKDGFENYWSQLRENDVEVSSSWDTAYYELFSGSAGKGEFPLVVSYATSPAAEIVFADPPITEAPTASISDTCFRQVEFAGILRGTRHESQAKELIDFLISEEFQKEIPLGLFVYPIRNGIELPDEFSKYVVDPEKESSLTPNEISENSKSWIDQWTQTVLR